MSGSLRYAMLSIPLRSNTTSPRFPLLPSIATAFGWRPSQPSSPKTTKLLTSSLPRRLSVVGSSASITVVTDQLESTDHLANGEEAEALGKKDAASDGLPLVDVPHPLEDRAGRGGRLLGALKQGAGVLNLLHNVAEVGLEGGNGPAVKEPNVSQQRTIGAFKPFSSSSTYGGVMFWPLKTILESSMPTLE